MHCWTMVILAFAHAVSCGPIARAVSRLRAQEMICGGSAAPESRPSASGGDDDTISNQSTAETPTFPLLAPGGYCGRPCPAAPDSERDDAMFATISGRSSALGVFASSLPLPAQNQIGGMLRIEVIEATPGGGRGQVTQWEAGKQGIWTQPCWS